MNLFNNEFVNYKGELKDKQLEEEYLNYRYPIIMKGFVPATFALCFLYALFLIPDFFLTAGKGFYYILIIRALTYVVFAALYYIFGRISTIHQYIKALTAFEIIFPILYIAMLMNYPQINFYIRCLDVVLITSLIFLVPNKCIRSTSAALFNIVVFFIYAHFFISYVSANDYFTGLVYIAAIFAINTLASYSANTFKRIQFIDNRKLQELLDTDTLTGTVSRIKFNEVLDRLMNESKITGKPLSLTIFDIDNFKLVNDNYGHITGDKVLKSIAGIIKSIKRPDDIFARWGGEEFVIILPSTGLEAAKDIAEEYREQIAQFVFYSEIKLTCSFGIAQMNETDTRKTLLRRADENMYKAKRAGRNAVVAE
jgi:diguanylate cyclase (GGDEF)-like protein